MTVIELIIELQKHPRDAQVMVWAEGCWEPAGSVWADSEGKVHVDMPTDEADL